MRDDSWFQTILNSVKDMVLVKDPESRLLWANQSFLDYYGMSQEQLRNIIDGPQSSPDDTLQYVKDDKYVVDNKTHLNIPSEPVTDFNGKVGHFHTVKSPVIENGKVVQTIAVARAIDLSDIHQQDANVDEQKQYISRFRSVIETIPIRAIFLDSGLAIIEANKLWTSTFGSQKESFCYFKDAYSHLEKLSTIVNLSLKNKNSNEAIEECVVNNSTNFFNYRVNPCFFPDGGFAGLFIVAHDVTEMKVKELELFQTQEKNNELATLLEAIEMGASHALISTNCDGLITSFNKAAEKMLGYKSYELIGKETPGVFHDLDEVIRRSGEFSKKLGVTVQAGFDTFVCHTNQGLKNEFDWTYVRKDKTKFPISLSVTALYNSKNDKIGYLGIARDLTELRAAEEALTINKKEQEILLARQNLALHASQVGIWEWDLTTNELVWDDQMYQLYGIQSTDFEGAYIAWEKGLHPEDKERATHEIQEAIAEKKKFDTEFRVKWPEGEVRTIRAMADLLKDSDGWPKKMIGVNWDITEAKNYELKLKKVNRQLSSANEELNQFAYRTSHDLKAPLISTKRLIKYILEDIQRGNLDEATSNSKKISGLMDKLTHLIEDILSLVKSDADVENDEGIDLTNLLEEIENNLSILSAESSCELRNDIEVEKAPVLQRVRLLQILENLISNGIKYSEKSRDNSYVRTKMFKKNSDLKIIVEDNGVGIPENKKDEVFDMFKRFHPELSFGSGLGMSIVKKHVDKMGGKISFTSSGKGTKFEVEIPNVYKDDK